MLSILGPAAVACALLLARPSAAPAADGDLVLTAELDRAAVKIGDAVSVKLSLANRTSAAIKVPDLRIAADAVSLAIAFDDEFPCFTNTGPSAFSIRGRIGHRNAAGANNLVANLQPAGFGRTAR